MNVNKKVSVGWNQDIESNPIFKLFGISYLLDIVLTIAATIMWTAALIMRLARCGITCWWILGYGMILLAGALAVALRKPNATEIAIGVIIWIVLQIPFVVAPEKPEDRATHE